MCVRTHGVRKGPAAEEAWWGEGMKRRSPRSMDGEWMGADEAGHGAAAGPYRIYGPERKKASTKSFLEEVTQWALLEDHPGPSAEKHVARVASHSPLREGHCRTPHENE